LHRLAGDPRDRVANVWREERDAKQDFGAGDTGEMVLPNIEHISAFGESERKHFSTLRVRVLVRARKGLPRNILRAGRERQAQESGN
jgi:hypothetical protein